MADDASASETASSADAADQEPRPSDVEAARADAARPIAPTPTNRTDASRFPLEVAVLGIGIGGLLIAAIVTLLSIDGGGDDQLTIGSEPDRPNPTYDASISDDDDRPAASENASGGRGIAITDEPIVIDADGNIVDPAGGNGDDELPSAAAAGDDGDAEGDVATLDVPDDAYTGDDTASADSVVSTVASTVADGEESDDDGFNLLGGDDPEDKRMPDLICRGLQAAQDEIQDRGVFGSKSEDATGRGRRQFWDRNWVVVAQDPEPGEKIGEFEAVLYVVKKSDDENICD